MHVYGPARTQHGRECAHADVCVCIRLCVHPHTHVGLDVCTQACVRVPMALWLRLHPGCVLCPPCRLSPKAGWQRGCCGVLWGCRAAWGGGTAVLWAAWTPLLSPFPASGAGSAASGCARVINHVAGVHARTHGRRQSRGLLEATPHTPLFPGTHPPCPFSFPTPLEISSCFPPFPLHPFALESSELVSRRGSRQEELQWGCFPQPAAIDK